MHATLSMLSDKALEILSILAENKRRTEICWLGYMCTLVSHFQIPYGRKYDKTWLLSMIQSKCSVPFNPIEVRQS